MSRSRKRRLAPLLTNKRCDTSRSTPALVPGVRTSAPAAKWMKNSRLRQSLTAQPAPYLEQSSRAPYGAGAVSRRIPALVLRPETQVRRMQLEGRVAVITGAASGIGLATARLFAREGATLLLGDVDEEDGRRAAEDIEAGGGRAEFVRTDVTSSEDVRGLVDGAVGRHGKLDIIL